MTNKTVLSDLYKQVAGVEPAGITELPSSGSNRRYFRLTGERTMIGVIGTCIEENEAFLYMAKHFASKNLPVPEVYAHSDDRMAYVQQDLGDTLLFNAIEKGRKTTVFSEEEKALLSKTIRQLPDIQFAGADGLDFSKCYPSSEFNARSIMWDLNYFKYCFLKATGMEFQEDLLEDDFQRLADVLLRSSSATFMYRDFQSRNVMIKDGKPWFIDFQGGRKGPVFYDVASFLWQAKANLPDSLRGELLEEYIDALRKYTPVDRDYFYAQLRHFVLFRTLQVLGAYGFRGYFEKKPHFIQSVPFAIANGRVFHENMRITMKDLTLKTSGSVGLDQSLQMVAEIPIAEDWIKGEAWMASLKGETIKIPITGSVTNPKLDMQAIKQIELAERADDGKECFECNPLARLNFLQRG